MIAKTVQELANAVNVVEMRLEDAGVVRSGDKHGLRKAREFSEALLLASNSDQVAGLIQEHPQKAKAFLTVLRQIREELEAAGFDIADVPDTPLMLYAPVADAVLEASRGYQRGAPFLAFLVQEGLLRFERGKFYANQ